MAPKEQDVNWDEIVFTFLGDRFNESDLKTLCFQMDPQVDWEALAGPSVARPERTLALLNMLKSEGRYYQLLRQLALAPQRQRLFRERRLHEPLCEEGVQLVVNGLAASMQPRRQRIHDPEECWNGADEVFDTLKTIHSAYLQYRLGTDPDDPRSGLLETESSKLLKDGKWTNAQSLLNRFTRYLPSDDRVHGMAREVDRMITQVERAKKLAEQGKWKEARAELDAVEDIVCDKGYAPSPMLREARRLFEQPEKLVASAIQAAIAGRWEQALADVQLMCSKYAADYPGVAGVSEQIERLNQWLASADGQVRAGQWQAVEQMVATLAETEHTYPGIPQLLERINRPKRWLENTQNLVTAGAWQAAQKAVAEIPQEDQTFPGVREVLARIERPRRWLDRAKDLTTKGEWQLLERELSELPPEDRTYPPIQEFQQKINRWEQLYQQAQQQMTSQAWEVAAVTLEQLTSEQPGWRDAAALLVAIREGLQLLAEAARLREAQDWDATEQALKQVLTHLAKPEHRETRRQLDELQHYRELYRQAEGYLAQHRYANALADFRALTQQEPNYRDSQTWQETLERWGRFYTAALCHIADKHWAEAESCLAQLCSECPDYEDTTRLLQDVRQICTVAHALRSPLVKDPWLVWEPGRYPYATMQAFDPQATPGADMETIQNTLYEVQGSTGGEELAAARAAWDELRFTDRRLFVDACLYTVRQSEPMLRLIEEAMAQFLQFPTADKLTAEFAEDAPVVLVLIGQRDTAIEKWQARQREQPRAGAVAHALGLCHLADAIRAETDNNLDSAAEAWRRALAQFVLALNDRNYWREWGRERGDVYRRPVLPNMTEELTHKLEADLGGRLTRRAERKSNTARSLYAQLQLEYDIEKEAVKALKSRGGIPLGAGRQAWFGPLYLAREPHLVEPLARYCAELSQQPDDIVEILLADTPGEDFVRRLRIIFSSLAHVRALLEGAPPQPEQALSQLTRLACDACPATCDDPNCTLHRDATPTIRLCCPACADFAVRNPAYSQLPAPGKTLLEDALYLATQAHLRLASTRIEQDESSGLSAVTNEWKQALALATLWDGEVKTRTMIREAALASVARLSNNWMQHVDTRRLDRAIGILEYLHEQDGKDSIIAAQLAEGLTNRAFYRIKRQFDPMSARSDMTRAYKLSATPTARTRDIYIYSLILVAGMTTERDRGESRRLLDEAGRLLNEGKRLFPDYAGYASTENVLRQTRADIDGDTAAKDRDPLEELREILGQARDTPASPRKQALGLREKGDLAAALELLERAWQQTPNDKGIQDELVTAFSQQIERFEEAKAYGDRDRLLAAWRQRLAGSPRLAQRINLAGWRPRILRYLQQIDFKFVPSTDSLLLPFDADTLGTVMVRLAVEEDLLALTAPLMLEAADEELALSNLLQVTGDLMCCKVCTTEATRFGLAVRIPLRELRPARLEWLARGLARYADIGQSTMSQMSALRFHVRAVHQMNEITASSLGLSTVGWSGLQHLAQHRNWQMVERNADQAEITGPTGTTGKGARPWVAQTSPDGLRLAADLGYLRSGRDRLDPLRRLLQLNGALGLGKLTLTEDARVWLAVELPDPDEASLEAALSFLEARSERLRSDLVQA